MTTDERDQILIQKVAEFVATNYPSVLLNKDRFTNAIITGFNKDVERKRVELPSPARMSEDLKKRWYILSNKTDCGDLSIYTLTADNEEDVKKYMISMMLDTAATCDPCAIREMKTDDKEGYIIYCDDEREDFRYIRADMITHALDNVHIAEANMDAIPQELDWDMDAVNYNIRDIGRDEGR